MTNQSDNIEKSSPLLEPQTRLNSSEVQNGLTEEQIETCFVGELGKDCLRILFDCSSSIQRKMEARISFLYWFDSALKILPCNLEIEDVKENENNFLYYVVSVLKRMEKKISYGELTSLINEIDSRWELSYEARFEQKEKIYSTFLPLSACRANPEANEVINEIQSSIEEEKKGAQFDVQELLDKELQKAQEEGRTPNFAICLRPTAETEKIHRQREHAYQKLAKIMLCSFSDSYKDKLQKMTVLGSELITEKLKRIFQEEDEISIRMLEQDIFVHYIYEECRDILSFGLFPQKETTETPQSNSPATLPLKRGRKPTAKVESKQPERNYVLFKMQSINHEELWEIDKKNRTTTSTNTKEEWHINNYEVLEFETTAPQDYFKSTDGIIAEELTQDDIITLFDFLCQEQSDLPGSPYLYKNEQQFKLFTYRLTGRQIPNLEAGRIIWRGTHAQLSVFLDRFFPKGEGGKIKRFFVLDSGGLYNNQNTSSDLRPTQTGQIYTLKKIFKNLKLSNG